MGGRYGHGPAEVDRKILEQLAKEELKSNTKERLMPKTRSNRVFISFAIDGEDGVNRLRKQIKKLAPNLEFDDFSLKKEVDRCDEDYIKRKLRDRIRRAAVAIIYLSPNAHSSKWMNWEIEECLHLAKPVIGIYKGASRPTLPQRFKTHKLKPQNLSYKKLTDAIKEILETHN